MPAASAARGHQPIERVDLAHQMAFAEAADGGVATHHADGVAPLRHQRCSRAASGGRRRGLAAGMAAANDDHVKGFARANHVPVSRETILTCQRTAGRTPDPTHPQRRFGRQCAEGPGWRCERLRRPIPARFAWSSSARSSAFNELVKAERCRSCAISEAPSALLPRAAAPIASSSCLIPSPVFTET